MWARTDTQGRAWVHPNAFDPAQAQVYDVLVRKNGQQAQGFLRRGQKSAVELNLATQASTAQARLELVFLIDATGSMADEIDKLKATLQSITSEVAQLPSRPDLCPVSYTHLVACSQSIASPSSLGRSSGISRPLTRRRSMAAWWAMV